MKSYWQVHELILVFSLLHFLWNYHLTAVVPYPTDMVHFCISIHRSVLRNHHKINVYVFIIRENSANATKRVSVRVCACVQEGTTDCSFKRWTGRTTSLSCSATILTPALITGTDLVRDNEFKSTNQRCRTQLPLISNMEGNHYDTICKGPERDHTAAAQPFISVNI